MFGSGKSGFCSGPGNQVSGWIRKLRFLLRLEKSKASGWDREIRFLDGPGKSVFWSGQGNHVSGWT